MAKYDIIGAFVFRNDGDGCITSKYINSNSGGPLSEAAKLIVNTDNNIPFCGKYRVVWLETSGSEEGFLHITHNTPSTYHFEWTNKNDKLVYKGIGMLYDGLLVGSYWSIDPKEKKED